MKEGQIYPPVTLWQDGSDGYFLVDGNTRVAAKRRNGTGTTDAYILELGSKDEAVAISASLNTLNGAQLNRDELQRAMLAMTRLGLNNKTIARKLGIPAAQVTRALAAEEFDKRAALQWPVPDDVKDAAAAHDEGAHQPGRRRPVFADLAQLVVDAELTSKDLTPLLAGIDAAGSEADRRQGRSPTSGTNRADDIARVATGRTTKGSPILESTRAFGTLRKLMDELRQPEQWVPANDDKRHEWLAVLDVLVPFLERVRAVYALATVTHDRHRRGDGDRRPLHPPCPRSRPPSHRSRSADTCGICSPSTARCPATSCSTRRRSRSGSRGGSTSAGTGCRARSRPPVTSSSPTGSTSTTPSPRACAAAGCSNAGGRLAAGECPPEHRALSTIGGVHDDGQPNVHASDQADDRRRRPQGPRPAAPQDEPGPPQTVQTPGRRARASPCRTVGQVNDIVCWHPLGQPDPIFVDGQTRFELLTELGIEPRVRMLPREMSATHVLGMRIAAELAELDQGRRQGGPRPLHRRAGRLVASPSSASPTMLGLSQQRVGQIVRMAKKSGRREVSDDDDRRDASNCARPAGPNVTSPRRPAGPNPPSITSCQRLLSR